ncbi:unnamed protein product [Medioppia subpectinata]|uniref:Uncharacterized protein n=1 Tax=Medioppia subpectinata TaxID=1979941 RepID=A0A7R9KET7_9ACAR|nr:unnamed protein product [Medioppia subpectinata]CAG2101020.1 unnamed protein product [Medioppia subpectinata]
MSTVKKELNLRHILIGSTILVFVLVLDTSLGLNFIPKINTRFCYNSPNPSTVNSQCVLCNYYLFDQTLLGCTGSTALSMNITAAQAFCVISNCLGQVKQSPVFLGRKKRSEDMNEYLNANDDRKSDGNTINGENGLKEGVGGEERGSQMVYKYDNNEPFIIAKEVEAFIVDLPEIIDDSIISTRMRVCVQSSDPNRLQSQCVYCNNRFFQATVRHCTTNTYLPASLTVEEAFCLVRICRRQLPSMRPEPYYPQNIQQLQPPIDTIGANDVDYTEPEALYSDNVSSGATTSKKRPPASFSVGKPQRPIVRPFLFGKRSIDDTYGYNGSQENAPLPSQTPPTYNKELCIVCMVCLEEILRSVTTEGEP